MKQLFGLICVQNIPCFQQLLEKCTIVWENSWIHYTDCWIVK